jgi:hypothetical protein
MEGAGLAEEDFQMLRDPAIFSFIAPLAALELLVMRLLALLGFRKFVEGTMVGVYRRAPARVSCSGHGVQASSGRPVDVK